MIRAVTEAEEDAVRRVLERAEPGLTDALLAGDVLAVVAQDDAHVVVAIDHLCLQLPAGLGTGADHGGLRIGTIEEDGFHLDLQGAVLWATQTDRGTVRVNEKATRLWLYGRAILGESVVSFDRRLRKGDACIVCNPRGEGLGIGIVAGRLRGSGTAVEPVLDLGVYLREQGT